MTIRLLAALTLGLALTGCTTSPPKSPPPTRSAPSTIAPSALDTPASSPAAKSKAGAIAFVRHYVDVLNHASTADHPEMLDELSRPGCLACRSITRLIRNTYAAGGHIEGGGWQVIRARSMKPIPGMTGVEYVKTLTRIHSQRIFPGAGGVPKTYPGGAERWIIFGLIWTHDHWKTAAIIVGSER